MTWSLMVCTDHQLLFGYSNQEECDGYDIWHVREQHKCIQGMGGERPMGKRPYGRPKHG